MKWSKMEGDYATDWSLWIHSIAVAIVLIAYIIYVYVMGSPYGVIGSRSIFPGAAMGIWLSEVIGRSSPGTWSGAWRGFDMNSPTWDGPSAATTRWIAWILLFSPLPLGWAWDFLISFAR